MGEAAEGLLVRAIEVMAMAMERGGVTRGRVPPELLFVDPS
jgi:hypothetical protein